MINNGNPGGDLLEETDSGIFSGLPDNAYLKDRWWPQTLTLSINILVHIYMH